MTRKRVFISAVSSELGNARRAAANYLLAGKVVDVSIQEHFVPERTLHTLLQAIRDAVRDSDVVICLIGARAGACPTVDEARDFIGMLPHGVTAASYTQWEFFFAKHYRKECLLLVADDAYSPDGPPTEPEPPGLQAAFVGRIKNAGLHHTPFKTIPEITSALGLQPFVNPAVAAQPQPAPLSTPAPPVNMPYPTLGSLFKGRDAFLIELRRSLTQSSGPTVIGSANTTIHGLGGIGKTRTAVEYAYAHQTDYTALLFASAETPDALTDNLGKLTDILVIPGMADQTAGARVAAVLNWLNQHPGWLLILDNVDSPEALAAIAALLGRLRQGHVLLTTRQSNLPDGFASLELDVLPLADAAAFLLDRTQDRRSPGTDDTAQAEGLARELGGLALALTHAAAYIRRQRCSLAAYRARLATSFDKVADFADPTVTLYPRSIAATWALSIERLTEPGRALLGMLAFLAPDPVPASLLEAVGDAAETVREALADLSAYSLVTRDTAKETFSVHRLVQDVTRRALPAEDARPTLEAALHWVVAGFEGDPQDPINWPSLLTLVEHAEAVADQAAQAGIDEPTAWLMTRLGSFSHARARYERAERPMRMALAILERVRGSSHPEVAATMCNLAALLQDTNRLTEAEQLYRRALQIHKTQFGPEHHDVARTMNNLALLMQEMKNFDEAETLLRAALHADEASLVPEHPAIARDLTNLGMLLSATNRRGEGEMLVRRGLKIKETVLEPDHPDIAVSLGNLAAILYSSGRLVEAEPLSRRAVVIVMKFPKTSDHPHPEVEKAKKITTSFYAIWAALRPRLRPSFGPWPGKPASAEHSRLGYRHSDADPLVSAVPRRTKVPQQRAVPTSRPLNRCSQSEIPRPTMR